MDTIGAAVGAIILTIIYNLLMIAAIIVIILGIKYRVKFFTVHEFSNDNVKLPEVVNKVGNEMTLKYANSFTKNNQFYLTTSRIIFHCQNLFKTKFFTRYFNINSVGNVEISYRNPYVLLIIAGIIVLIGIILGITTYAKSSSNTMYFQRNSDSGAGSAMLIIFIFLIMSGLFVLLWYYLKGYYLAFDNGKLSGLFCRSREGLEDTLKRFDILRFTNKTITIPGPKNEVQESKDVICSSCKSVISLEAEDLKSSTFVCPICSTVNSIK
jgi:hypothetical protein